LKALYPTHPAYVRAVRKNVAELINARFITREDGEKLVAEARRAKVP
jgi:hypothetical protein